MMGMCARTRGRVCRLFDPTACMGQEFTPQSTRWVWPLLMQNVRLLPRSSLIMARKSDKDNLYVRFMISCSEALCQSNHDLWELMGGSVVPASKTFNYVPASLSLIKPLQLINASIKSNWTWKFTNRSIIYNPSLTFIRQSRSSICLYP